MARPKAAAGAAKPAPNKRGRKPKAAEEDEADLAPPDDEVEQPEEPTPKKSRAAKPKAEKSFEPHEIDGWTAAAPALLYRCAPASRWSIGRYLGGLGMMDKRAGMQGCRDGPVRKDRGV